MDDLQRLKESNKTMENKLLTVTKSTKSNPYDDSELQCWFQKIDAIYSSVIKSQEYYYGMQSKEKILRFRSRLKEKAEECKKILTLDKATIQDVSKA